MGWKEEFERGNRHFDASVEYLRRAVRAETFLAEIEKIADARADVDDGIPNDYKRILDLARLGIKPNG